MKSKISTPKSGAKQKPVVVDETAAPSVAPMIGVITFDQLNELWNVVYRIDSIEKLLDRSERLGNCDCFLDTTGPKVIADDAMEELRRLLYDIGENPKVPWPADEPIPDGWKGGVR